MNNPKISILVPIYKVPEMFLRQCIESLMGQTLKEIEIILVDDGSPDQCGAICDEYAEQESRIKVIHKQNGGLATARNSAQDVATGECIMFVDGDDYLEPTCCEHAYNALVTHNVQMVLFNIMTKYSNSSVPFTAFEENMLFDEQGCKDLQVRVLDFNGRIAQVFAKLIRRDHLTQHNVRHIDELKQGAEGFVFNIALFEHLESAYFLAEPLYYYVFNEQSITHTPNEENYYLIVRCFEYVEQFIHRSKNRERLERQLLVRMLYVVCSTAVTGYFNPTNNASWKEKIAGMERFLDEPLVKRSIINAYDRGGGE